MNNWEESEGDDDDKGNEPERNEEIESFQDEQEEI